MQTELRDGTLHISGDITVKTLTADAFTRFRQQCRLKDTRAVDLSGVGRADSACVSPITLFSSTYLYKPFCTVATSLL